MTLQGKTVHELQTLERTQVSDSDLLLVGDISEPLISKAMTINGLRVIMGAVYQTDESINAAIDTPTWVVEGAKGYWKISVLSAVEDALGYYLYYYDDDLELFVLYPKVITEIRAELGMSGGALVLEVYALRDGNGISPRSYRRFKIQTFTETEQSPQSAEQSAYTITSLPASFTPTTPTLVDDVTYPFTSALPSYNGYSHGVFLRVNAAAGETDYIYRYEMQRRDYVLGQGDNVGWTTLPMHTLSLDPTKPAPSKLIYHDDSAKAAPGDVFDYRVRAVDTNGKTSDWTAPGAVVNYTVEEDDTAPDAPVLTVRQIGLGFEIDFDDPTQNGGDPCDDLQYWELLYNKDGGGWNSVLNPNDAGGGWILRQEFSFRAPDGDLSSSYIFKAKAFDWSGNASAYSADTAPASPLKFSDAVMDPGWSQRFTDVEDGVSSNATDIIQNANDIILRATKVYVDGATILGQITVNAGNINLKVAKDDVINQINISTEGILIAGDNLSVDANTTFSADVIIQGILKSTGGIKSGSGTTRVELGTFDGSHNLKLYVSNTVVGLLEAYAPGSYGRLELSNVAGTLEGDYYHGHVELRKSSVEKVHLSVSGTDGFMRINTIKVIGVQGSAVADATDAASVILRLNELLAEVRTHGLIAT